MGRAVDLALHPVVVGDKQQYPAAGANVPRPPPVALKGRLKIHLVTPTEKNTPRTKRLFSALLRCHSLCFSLERMPW